MSQAGLFKRGPADEDRSPFSNEAHRIDCCDAPFTSETGQSLPKRTLPVSFLVRNGLKAD
jgi:hypothetical protein